MLRSRHIPYFLLLGMLAFVGCDQFAQLPAENDVLDAPIDGLTGEQMQIHIAGDEEFGRRFTPDEGLGPLFVASACDSCHPAEGKGHPLLLLKRFGRGQGSTFDPLPDLGGPQLQTRAIPGFQPEEIPPEAQGIAGFLAPAVTGLGYIEAVDDATLFDLEDPNDDNRDGISGRVQLVRANDALDAMVEASNAGSPGRNDRNLQYLDGYYVGRFGKKGSSINLLHQTVNAYSEDMGLTTEFLPEDLFHPTAGNLAHDGVPDPEISTGVLSNVVFYLRTLRVPLRRNETDPDVAAGERLFETIQCAACHVPALQTGRSEIPALDQVTFYPYSDLLLHDMGPELDDGYTEGRALTAEWRTPPLWGLGLAADFQGGTGYYMHDGRAETLREAIALHGGEGSQSRAAFDALTPTEQEQLLAFLNSL